MPKTRPNLRAQRATHERLRPGVDGSSPAVIRACTGKLHGYITRKRALQGARAATKRGGVRLYVYPCSYCRRFHFTSKEPTDHSFGEMPIPGVHNGRRGRLWLTEFEDELAIECFVDRVLHLVGLNVRELGQ